MISVPEPFVLELEEDLEVESPAMDPRAKQLAESKRMNALAVLDKTNAENEASSRVFTLHKLRPALGYCVSVRAHNSIGWSQVAQLTVTHRF